MELEIFDRIQDSGVPLREIVQSDEGGRFFEEVARYSLVWLDIPSSRDDGRLDSVTEHPEYRWVSLDELNMLCATPLTTTNELRTLVSLVIS